MSSINDSIVRSGNAVAACMLPLHRCRFVTEVLLLLKAGI